MSRSSNGRTTTALATASEILRSLTPDKFAALLVIDRADAKTQTEIADTIGRTQATVSQYLQSLEALPIPLAQQERHYSVTDTGRDIIVLIDNMLSRQRVNINDIDWSLESDKDEVAACLTPLYDSRSTEPFFLLASLNERSGITSLLSTLQPVPVDDVVHDVSARLREIDESTTPKQIRQIIRRFDDTNAVDFEEDQITLTSKGREHALLLDQLTQMVEDEMDESVNNEHGSHSKHSDSHDPSRIASLLDPRPFRGGRQPTGVNREINESVPKVVQESPTIVPAYYVLPSDDAESGEGQNSELMSPPILPFESLTVKELTDYANQLDQEYDDDAQLEPYWALRTEDGLFPLGTAQLTLGTLGLGVSDI